MIEFKTNNKELFERMHNALKGSKCYINSDVVLTTDGDDKENPYSLIVGENSIHDMKLIITE